MSASSYFAALVMWLAMTGIMMAPVVFPWVRALHRRSAIRPTGRTAVATLPCFVAGYAAAWSAFSAVAALVHSSLASSGFSIPFGPGTRASAAVLLVAGGYQFTGLKKACLRHCRSPAGYLLLHWRQGSAGWLRLGFRHGLFCVGCCWSLMALAFVVGMSSLLWMGAMAAIMLAETALPFGSKLASVAGALLLAAGAGILLLSWAPWPAR